MNAIYQQYSAEYIFRSNHSVPIGRGNCYGFWYLPLKGGGLLSCDPFGIEILPRFAAARILTAKMAVAHLQKDHAQEYLSMPPTPKLTAFAWRCHPLGYWFNLSFWQEISTFSYHSNLINFRKYLIIISLQLYSPFVA